MCGIAGLIALDRHNVIDPAALHRMVDAIAHRGPDGSGIWLSPNGVVGLAHRRLSIIDLDERAGQPMADVQDRLRIVYNGEIYNHAELRRELLKIGARFATDHSDTEVLLQGYHFWGLEGLLTRLEGMYAFALFDRSRNCMFLARDPIGIKPLYFTELRGQLAFASEIKALLQLKGLARRIDPVAARHYLTFMVAPSPATMFAGIAKLPAGHILTVAFGEAPKAASFWDPASYARHSVEVNEPEQNSARRVRSLLEESVRKHMVSDVPVGVFLSGGVDSGAILALMSRYSRSHVRTFTVGFRGSSSYNELNEARETARRFNAEHHEVLIGPDDAAMSLDDIVRQQDEPLADWVCVPLWHVAKLAATTGTKAILVGEGADELFIGYQSYLRFLQLHENAALLRRILPSRLATIAKLGASMLPVTRLGLRGQLDHIGRSLSGGEAFWTGAIAYWEMQKQAIVVEREATESCAWDAYGLRSSGINCASSAAIACELLATPNASDIDIEQHSRMRIAELRLRLPELLLMRVDKMTMAHGLEARVPFLDRPLVEHALGLNLQALLPEGHLKGLLKAAVADLLPREVLDRPKRGFAAPVAEWLRGKLGRSLQAEVESSPILEEVGLHRARIGRLFEAHRSSDKDYSLWLWPLINLAIWHRLWIRGGPH